jgi:DMSO reductase family type II enzyme molybdopterin subunit
MTTAPEARWSWDQVTWGSHCGNCIANCTYRVYVKDGEIVHQEQSGGLPTFDGVPDMNPLGCQKGGAWHTQAHGDERLLHPLRRVGDRGSGQWEAITWDEALDSLADAVIDAIEAEGTNSVLCDPGPESGLVGGMGRGRFASAIDSVAMDANSTVSDVHLGHWMTFGGLLGGSSADDTFRADTILVWNGNPAYTRIPYFHYLTEARYRGATVVLIAPDFSPSAPHVDLHVGLRPGTDAALALAMCGVVVSEDLFDRDFVCSQTDLPLLVRRDTSRFLRDADVTDDGRSDRFWCWRDGALTPVDPGRLDDPRAATDVELDGTWTVSLHDGSEVEVTTVFSLLRERLAGYTPEEAGRTCGVHADTIRSLARMVAGGRTKLQNGLGSCKHHHGDLMERSMDLLLALTGNWGADGRGLDTYIIALMEGEILGLLKGDAGIDAAEASIGALDAILDAMTASDPAMTEAKAVFELMKQGAAEMTSTPPAFFFWYHCGYDEMWEHEGWSDNPRPHSDYITESQSRGWWSGLVRPRPQTTPKVLLQAGTNILRRTRGGQRQLLRHLWPDLDMIAVLDWKMSTVGLHADLVLPVACEHERLDLHAANSHAWERMLADKAVEPPGESRTDWAIFRDLAAAVSRRAAARGLESFVDSHGVTRPYAGVIEQFTMGGVIVTEEDALDELLHDSALSGNLAAGTSVASLRETGWIRPQQLPRIMTAVCGGDLPAEGPFVAYRDHVESAVPFPTLTGRAQFYIDHPWFLEADEQLPVHKEPPPAGGDHPLQLTGGHPRWSIHATNSSSQVMLETTRGRPTVHLNTEDAAERGIADGDLVRVWNDVGDLRVAARVTPAARPGQVILYAAWEQYLFPEWRDVTWVEPGMVKWLHFAGGYGHLAYSDLQWQPQQSDRLYRVDVELAT